LRAEPIPSFKVVRV